MDVTYAVLVGGGCQWLDDPQRIGVDNAVGHFAPVFGVLAKVCAKLNGHRHLCALKCGLVDVIRALSCARHRHGGCAANIGLVKALLRGYLLRKW
jgi:hypothetical protein